MRTMTLCNEVFEYHKSSMHPVAPIHGYNRYEIFEVYEKPSQAKINIWNYWCNWCNEMIENGFECGIQIESHNCMTFTVSGYLWANDTHYDIWITKSHNRIYEYNA